MALAKIVPTQEQIDTATEYVKSAAGQKYCPVHRLNCNPLCVCFQVKSYAKGMQAHCAHFKITISERAYSA